MDRKSGLQPYRGSLAVSAATLAVAVLLSIAFWQLDGVQSPVKMSTVAVDVKDPDLWEFAAPVAMRYDRRVIRWSPMSPDSMGHNFLDYVHTVGDTVDMAETVLSNDTEYNRKDPFWRQTELNMLAATLQLVCEEPADRLMPDLLRY